MSMTNEQRLIQMEMGQGGKKEKKLTRYLK